MIPVSQLRLELLRLRADHVELEALPKVYYQPDLRTHPTFFGTPIDRIPNEIATANCTKVLGVMEAHNLDATRLGISADGGFGIIWQSIFTPGRYAHIECTNDGAVCGVRTDANCSIDDPNQFRFWWIGELCPENWDPTYTGPGPGELNLTTEEAIEHIRCFIWADYK
jgi:hypothetical protein